MTWLLILPAVLIVAVYVLVYALCKAAKRGDEVERRAFDDKFGGWRN